MSEINHKAYDILLGAQFEVTLSRNGEDIKFMCRPLPFTTLMSIIGDVMLSAHAQLTNARRQIMEDFVTKGLGDMEPNQVIDVMMPIVSSVAVEAPELIERFLMDVCVEMAPEYLKAFELEDILIIVEATLARIDIERVAEKARKVFSQATDITKVMMETQIKKDTVVHLNKQRRKKFKSPSQSKSPVSI